MKITAFKMISIISKEKHEAVNTNCRRSGVTEAMIDENGMMLLNF
jgi:hypothetical protein